jgi:DNA-binding HxlR family transcriptional regulator
MARTPHIGVYRQQVQQPQQCGDGYEKVCLIRGDGGRAIRGILDRIGSKWTLLVIA